eukprot:m.30538 g.30538  ORF g.30538 m.30538 type:complete len:200 (+) comp5233_c0_seq1:158-757(+)
MAFHFSKERPDEQLLGDIAASEKLADEAFAELAELLFSFLTSPGQAARMVDQVTAFAASAGVAPAAMKSIVRSWLAFLRAAQRANLSAAAVKEDLVAMGIANGRAKYIGKTFKANIVAMSRSALSNTLMVNQLEDMQWKFGVSSGSSEAKSTGNTFMQIKMTLNRGTTSEDVFMELTLQQFYNFCHEMEKAKANLEYLS